MKDKIRIFAQIIVIFSVCFLSTFSLITGKEISWLMSVLLSIMMIQMAYGSFVDYKASKITKSQMMLLIVICSIVVLLNIMIEIVRFFNVHF